LDGNFEGLFDSGSSEEDTDVRSNKGSSRFTEVYGWQHCTKLVAEYEGCSVSEAYELNAMEYLNILSYLKAERDFKKNG
jgi:hypothetical protein